MGDRAQVAIKDNGGKVYLYGHWIGTDIYRAAADAIRQVPGRVGDSEYFARAVFVRMIPENQMRDETGFGIGTAIHGDVEHPVPVFDCDTGKVSWEADGWKSEQPGYKLPRACTFAQFAENQAVGKYDKL